MRRFHLSWEGFICHEKVSYAMIRFHLPWAGFICHDIVSSAMRRFHLPWEDFMSHGKVSSDTRRFHLPWLCFICHDIVSSAIQLFNLQLFIFFSVMRWFNLPKPVFNWVNLSVRVLLLIKSKGSLYFEGGNYEFVINGDGGGGGRGGSNLAGPIRTPYLASTG